MNDDEDPFLAHADAEAKFIAPDYSLKEKIGLDIDLKAIFTPELIESAQQKSIEGNKEKFMEWVLEDLGIIEEHFKNASATNPPSLEEVRKLEFVASRIRAQAGTFGYGLATLIAKSLCNFCNRQTKIENVQLIVIRKHIDTLLVIFNQKIKGDGGSMGAELLGSLTKLTEKYA